MKTIKYNTLIQIAVVIFTFIISIIITPLYYEGDQIGYTNAYNDMRGSNLLDGFFIYQNNITTIEPIHFGLTWLFTNLGFDKIITMTLFNCFLSLLIVKILQKFNTNNFIILLILLSNFYLYVLYFSAERLKFSFIFLSLAILNFKNRKILILFLLLAIFTHLQNIIIIVALFFAFLINNIYRSNIFNKFNKKYLFLILLLLIPIYLLKEQIYSKFLIYADISNANSFIKNTWQSILLYLLSLKYSQNKIFTTSLFSIIIIASALVGSDRITIFAYICFLYYSIKEKRGVNLLNICFIIYFIIKTGGFINNIFENGHGF